ncbi:MAG: tetratricopeptide repeat protein [Bdellovibrionota bacterium]
MSSERSGLDLKKPDEFVSLVETLYTKGVRHKRPFVLSIVAVFAIIFIAFGYLYWKSSIDRKAAVDFATLTEKVPGASFDSFSMGEDEKKAWDAQVIIADSKSFLEKHGQSSMAPVAHLYLAKAYVKANQLDLAAQEFASAAKGLRGNDQTLAKEGLGIVKMSQNDFKGAAEVFQSLVALKENPNADVHQWNLGLCFEGMGEVKKAQEAFALFETKYSNSTYAEKAKYRLFAIQHASNV